MTYANPFPSCTIAIPASRSLNFCTFPLGVVGYPSTQKTYFGTITISQLSNIVEYNHTART